ncbi:MAG TPA: type IV pilus assembly protein PilM [Nitrospirae bacterium]|nr:competence protein A [bacterium BMS3Abin10]GBE38916.1 competence protein A [bacterium BMS3Bbin08]HDH50252.1 type IV pilus assembly protein PilM [Nitrospirota bacterium]HDK81471.1 type IV pilus assembly protein PilM [Nitrospirota bacterium]
MLFGGGRGKGIIGLDIGSREIKAVQLKEVKNGYELENLGMAPILPELIVDGSILDSLRVVDTIKELIAEKNFRIKDVALGVSGHSSVIIKRVALPQMTEEELQESIKFEAEQYIPFDIEDVNLDFQILGQREEGNQMDVMIVAVKKDKITEYVSVVREAGFNPAIVDVDVFALENMYEINYDINAEDNIALVNIGAGTININILKGGTSIFTRDSSVGGNLHTEALQRGFTVSFDDAERLKQGEAVEGVSLEEVASVLTSASEDIITEISRSFDYFRGATSQEEINEIVLSGGCALVKDFVPLLSERIGINVKVIEPFRNIHVPDSFDIGYIKKTGPLMAVAAGLALRRVGDR